MGSLKKRAEHTSRVQGVDVDAKIHRLACADPVFDFLDDPLRPDRIDGAGLDDFEAAVAVVFVVAGTGKRGADAGVNVAVIGQQAFQVGMVKVGPVVDRRLRRGRTSEHFGPPSVSLGRLSG